MTGQAQTPRAAKGGRFYVMAFDFIFGACVVCEITIFPIHSIVFQASLTGKDEGQIMGV